MITPTLFALVAGAFIAIGLGIASLYPGIITRFPRSVIGALLAATIASVASLIQLSPFGFTISVDPASEPLINRSDPGLPAYRQAIRDFGNDDVYVIVIETQDVFSEENLSSLRRLTHRLRGLPGIAAVESLARVLDARFDSDREMVRIDDFMDRVPDTEEQREALRLRALAHPIFRKSLLAPDGRSTAINLTFRPMSDGEFVELRLDERIEALLREEQSPNRRFYVAGRPHVRSQAYHMIIGDLTHLIPIAVVAAALSLWLMTGSLPGVLIPLVGCLTATLWVFGAMAVMQININLITIVLGPMLICLGNVYGVHVYARFEIEAAAEPLRAATRCLEYSRTPVLMAGFTTCIGFGALLLADIPATNELGLFSIFGIASVTLISLTGIPAALSLLRFPDASRGGRQPGTSLSRAFGARLDRILTSIQSLSIDHASRVLGIFLVATIAALAAIPRIAIDSDVITFFQRDSRVRTDFDAVNRLITGAVPIYVMVSGHEEGAFRDPENLAAVALLQTELESLDGVSQVLSSIDLISLMNRALHRGSSESARIPDTRQALAEATFALPKSQLRRFTNSNHSRVNLIVRTGRSGSEAVRELEERILQVLSEARLPEGFTTEVAGNTLLINRGADGIAGNQSTQVGFAAVTIFALISFVFRSYRVAFIAMIPNIVPILIFFGLLGAGIAPLSLPTSLIGSIALGIAIDDTMHFLVAYLARRGEGRGASEAARSCIRRVGRPIALTSIMLVAGFSTILFSGFATLQEFGYLTAMTMGICLITDLILLPALLVRLDA